MVLQKGLAMATSQKATELYKWVAGGAICACCTLAGGLIGDLRSSNHVAAIANKLHAHEQKEGHTTMKERVNRLESELNRRLDRIDATLRRIEAMK